MSPKVWKFSKKIQKRLDDSLYLYYDFWSQRIKIYQIGVFLGRSEVSRKILENFQNEFTKKWQDISLRYYDFWYQRIEIYQKGMFLGRSEVSPKILEIFQMILLKNGLTTLLDIMNFGIIASRSIK